MMGATLEEARPALAKMIAAIQSDPSLLTRYPKTSGHIDTRLTVESLADLAGNHLFDDAPPLFGLTGHEACTVRSFFRQGGTSEYGGYDYVGRLRDTFPGVFDSERPEYRRRINGDRGYMGLAPLPPSSFGLEETIS